MATARIVEHFGKDDVSTIGPPASFNGNAFLQWAYLPDGASIT